jgi:DNA repair exonuclease SbcCD nuclease subunit
MAKHKQLIAIAFSDLHITENNQYSEGQLVLNSSIDVIHELRAIARKYKVPVLFTGDLFHNPKQVSNLTLNTFLNLRPFSSHASYFAISGNHDFAEQNTADYRAISHLGWVSAIFPSFKQLDWASNLLDTGITVHGIPYLQHNIGLVSSIKFILKDIKVNKREGKHILLLHTDLPNARDTDGRIVGTADNLPEDFEDLLSKFDLVLCGHIHKFQKVYPNTYIVGSPLQQRLTDMDNEMGYLKVYDDMSVEFVPIKNTPTFRYYDEGDEKPDDKNYWVKRDTYMSEEEIQNEIVFNPGKSRTKLAKKYCKANNITSPTKKKALINSLKNS